MPKNPIGKYRRNGNYGYDENAWNHQDERYLYKNQENYPNPYYDENRYGGNRNYYNQTNNNYNYRRRWPYDVNQRSYRQNYYKRDKGQPMNKKENLMSSANNVRPSNNVEIKPLQNASSLLNTLSKTAEVVSTQNVHKENKENKEVNISTTKKLNEKTAVEKPQRLNFHVILEEQEQAVKALKIAAKLEQQQLEYLSIAANKINSAYEEETIKSVKLFQTREELVQQTKGTQLYKVSKEQIKQNGLRENDPKTPETAVETSQWKEIYFKPWKMNLSRLYFQYLDGNDSEDDKSVLG